MEEVGRGREGKINVLGKVRWGKRVEVGRRREGMEEAGIGGDRKKEGRENARWDRERCEIELHQPGKAW